MLKQYLIFVCFWVATGSIIGQELQINELMSSNSSYLDDFGESSDWIELYHAGTEKLNLQGWALSDKIDENERWTFEGLTINPGEFLLIRASDRNITDPLRFKTLIKQGDEWKYMVPDLSTSNQWILAGFDDDGWETGLTGIGYGDGDDQTTVPGGTQSVFLRKKFMVDDTTNIREMLLHVDYDDGFIAYLNGIEIARANLGVPGEPVSNLSGTDVDHEAVIYNGQVPEEFDVSDYLDKLKPGENLLAVQVHNVSSSSSDLSIIPFLTLGLADSGPNEVPDLLNLPNQALHTDFKLSADGESLYLYSDSGALVDSVQFPALPRDISYGRKTEQSEQWVKFKTPTPGAENGGEIYLGELEEKVEFSHNSGFYTSSFYLSLSGADTIFYTLDASDPDISSNFYKEPIRINHSTLVRARVYKNKQLGKIYNRDLLLENEHDLPVISLNTESKYLWDKNIGMYVLGYDYESNFPYFGANFWEDWEYPFQMSYFDENGDLKMNTDMGVSIFGGYSRALDQKSLSLFARSKYGDSSFDYPFFPNRDYDSFEALVLRNGGNDWDRALIRDVVMTSLMAGTEIDFQAYQPVVCYLNGDYWGVYNLREKINEHYLASLHDVGPDDIDLLELNGSVKNGNNSDYIALRNFIQNNSLKSNSNYQFVIDQIDLTNYIQYHVAQIYFNNTDWPGNNIRYWKTDETKWRWILYDTDFGLNLFDINGYKHNTLDFALYPYGSDWPNPSWSTLFLRKLVENDQFRQKFVNYFADAMNSIFLPFYANAHIDAVINSYHGELDDHLQRWNLNSGNWSSNIERMKLFFNLRPSQMREHIKSQFDLPASWLLNLKVGVAQTGTVQVNSLHIDVSNWSGFYFENNPITLKAIANPGYTFVRWSGDVSSSEDSITVNLTKATNITAHFGTTSALNQPVVINEINYNAPDSLDAGDWIELHNFSDEAKDISEWILRDDEDDHAFVFPENTMIDAYGFLIVTRNQQAFSFVYPEVESVIGEMDFGLSSEGDAVRLFDDSGILMDSVRYLPDDPWPPEANGKGATLELIYPDLDNALSHNWHSYGTHGTPGMKNHSYDYTDKLDSPVLLYPNPVRDQLSFRLIDYESYIRSVRIYDMQGRFITEENYLPHIIIHELDISALNPGVYLAVFHLGDERFFGNYFEKF